jgi:hypothetical protein
MQNLIGGSKVKLILTHHFMVLEEEVHVFGAVLEGT